MFNLLFIGIGVGLMIGGFFAAGNDFLLTLVLFFMGVIFSAIGFFMATLIWKPFTFDLDANVYYRGKSYDSFKEGDDNECGSLRNIHALQIIREH